MPPAAARNVCVVFFDLKITQQQDALNTLSSILLYNQFSESKDECQLFVINSDKGISYIDTHNKIDKIIESILDFQLGHSNLLEVLEFGIQKLKKQFALPGVVTLQFLLISDLNSFKTIRDEKIENALINDLNSYDIFLYVIGPNIEPSRTLFSENDIRAWMKNIDISENDTIKTIIINTNHSVICSFNLGLYILNSFKFRKGKQPWMEPLSFGSSLTLSFPTIKLTANEEPFKLKADKINSEMKWVYENEENMEINSYDAVSGLVLHGKFVKIDTEERFKIHGPKCFSVLGFTDAKNIPEYLLQAEDSYIITPNGQQDESYLEFFYALINEMINLKKYIVAKKVYYANLTPKYVVLIPKLDSDLRGLISCELPYAEDIAFNYNENLTDPFPIEISDVVHNFLDALNVSSKTCQIKIPLAPQLMVDTNCIKIINKVQELSIEEKLITKKNVEFSNYEVGGMEKLKISWPIRDIEEIKKEENLDDFDDVDDFDYN